MLTDLNFAGEKGYQLFTWWWDMEATLIEQNGYGWTFYFTDDVDGASFGGDTISFNINFLTTSQGTNAWYMNVARFGHELEHGVQGFDLSHSQQGEILAYQVQVQLYRALTGQDPDELWLREVLDVNPNDPEQVSDWFDRWFPNHPTYQPSPTLPVGTQWANFTNWLQNLIQELIDSFWP